MVEWRETSGNRMLCLWHKVRGEMVNKWQLTAPRHYKRTSGTWYLWGCEPSRWEECVCERHHHTRRKEQDSRPVNALLKETRAADKSEVKGTLKDSLILCECRWYSYCHTWFDRRWISLSSQWDMLHEMWVSEWERKKQEKGCSLAYTFITLTL